MIRHEFIIQGDTFSPELVIFEVPDESVLTELQSVYEDGHRWNVIVETDQLRFGKDAFGDTLLMAHKRVDDRFVAVFAKAQDEDVIIEWSRIFGTLAPYDEVETPKPVHLINDPTALAQLGGALELTDRPVETCQQNLSVFVNIESLGEAPDSLKGSAFSQPPFPQLSCQVDFKNEQLPIAGSLHPGLAGRDDLTATEGANVLFRSDTALVLSNGGSLQALKAYRLLDIDGIPALLHSTPTTLGATVSFLKATATMNSEALNIPISTMKENGSHPKVPVRARRLQRPVGTSS